MTQPSRNPHRLAIFLLAAGMGAHSLQAQPPGPVLAWSTYAGGDHFEGPTAVAVDPAGNSYLIGSTLSSDFPLPDPTPERRDWDVFVLKVSPAGALLWAARLGHRGNDYGFGVAVDPAGHAWITGRSADFPEVDPLMPSTGGEDAFVARLDRNGAGLLFSTHLGGGRRDWGTDIAVDAAGHVYIAGATDSYDFPLVNPLPPPSSTFELNAFVTKLSPGGESILYSTYLGGRSRDEATAIAVDARGHAYVGGVTFSWDFPTVAALQPVNPSGWRAGFVTKLDPSGSSLVFSTYVGGSAGDQVFDLAVDATGEAFITGTVSSNDFPVLRAVQPTRGGDNDAFLMRLGPDGALLSSTYFGGSWAELATGIALDPVAGVVTVAGITDSRDLPLRDPLQDDCHQPIEGMFCLDDVFVARWSRDGSALLFSTFLGGWERDGAEDIAAVPGRGVVVTGTTESRDFPTQDAFQPALGVFMDNFLLMLRQNASPACTAASASPAVIWPPNGKLVPVAVSGVTDPDGDPVEISVTRITQDEPLSKRGQPDATGLGTALPMLRASREGKGDGRVYHLTFTATDPSGAACTGMVTVCVPHDPGDRKCGDGGPLYTSTL